MTAETVVRYVPANSDHAAFDEWLGGNHGVLALHAVATDNCAWTDVHEVRLLAFGASDGTAFVVEGTDVDFVRMVLAKAVQGDKRWWAYHGTQNANSICAAFGVRLLGLQCALTLIKVLDPDLAMKKEPALGCLQPLVQTALEGTAVRRGKPVSDKTSDVERAGLSALAATLPATDNALQAYAAASAVECARLVERYGAQKGRDLRLCVLNASRDEDNWRWVAIRGYLIDTNLLTRELAAGEATMKHAKWRWGVDLTLDNQRTRDWLGARGIVITDAWGKPSLSNAFYGAATVPTDMTSDWLAFQEVRRAGSQAKKLKEIARLTDSRGRVYPTIRSMGASTGRMTVVEPALQNIQPALRPLLKAEPGHVLVACDLDRIEPCVIAGLSADTALTQAVQGDLYVELAVAVWGESARTDPARRAVAKVAFLASLYGQGATGLGANLNITLGEAEEFLDGLWKAYPTMAKWRKDLIESARRGTQLQTAGGRALPQIARESYLAVNQVVQGTAADIFKAMVADVVHTLGRESLWLPLHDELIVQVPLGQEQVAVAALRKAMTSTFRGVPLTGTPVVLGSTWKKEI